MRRVLFATLLGLLAGLAAGSLPAGAAPGESPIGPGGTTPGPAAPALPQGAELPPAPGLPPRLEPPATPSLSRERAPPPQVPREAVRPPVPAVAPEPDPGLRAELERLREAAARNGRPAAQAAWRLGLASLHGVGGPVQPAQAQAWFDRAQRLGEPLAAAGLAWCALEGCGQPPDLREARRWIAALAPFDAARARYLEWLLATRLAPLQLTPPAPPPGSAPAPAQGAGRDNGVPHRDLLEAAARAGSPHARLELGLAAAAGGRDVEALAHFRAAAPRLPAAAANIELLGDLRNTPPKPGGPGQANFERAQRAHRGVGQPANFTEAVRLYRQAQLEGSVAAGRMLALIFSRPLPDGSVDIAWMQQLAQVDVTREVPVVDPSASRGVLRREPTALSDLLPEAWRASASAFVPR